MGNPKDPGPAGTAQDLHGSAPVWVLLGQRRGDNLQMLALAEAIGVRYRALQLKFNPLSALPNHLLGATLVSVRAGAAAALSRPWPRLTISSGRRAVPAALWIRRRSAGTTRLVHIGRPWAPVSWFDLVITTPQYRLPDAANVLHNLMPLISQSRLEEAVDESCLEPLSGLPRPWIALLTGGNSRPFRFDAQAASLLGIRASALAARAGGSVLIVPGPRTPAAVLATLRAAISAPCRTLGGGAGPNPYPALRRRADRFIVTCDSAAMLAELATTGKPVEVFPLPRCADARIVLGAALQTLARNVPGARRLCEGLVSMGLLTSVRDLDRYVQALRDAGVLRDAALARTRQCRELAAAAAAARALLSRPRQTAAGLLLRERRSPAGAHARTGRPVLPRG